MQLTAHDLRILQHASTDVQGCLTYTLSAEGSLLLQGRGLAQPLPAGDSLPKLEQIGLVSRGLHRTLVLTPQGWDVVRDLV